MSNLPPPPAPRLIESAAELEELCGRWLGQSAIALDTEFVRTRTFFAQLGLIQVGDDAGCYLVDYLAIDAWQPLVEVLSSSRVRKILHSPGEDLEVLHQELGVVPQPLFDTQIAAAFVGLGASIGYQRLVQELFGIELPKAEQRSNWLRRPLGGSQVRYAALDVAYLLPAHERLVERLDALGRGDWAEEEFETLPAVCLGRNDPERVYLRLHRASLPPGASEALWALVRWREEEARRRDLPRGFIVQDAVLSQIARRRPRKTAELEAFAQLRPEDRRRYGEQLIAVIEEAAKAALQSPPPVPAIAGRSRGRVDELRRLVADVAREHDLPPELVAPRRVLEEAVRSAREHSSDLPPELGGWRRDLLGERLRAQLED
jgi:ribonuclease D